MSTDFMPHFHVGPTQPGNKRLVVITLRGQDILRDEFNLNNLRSRRGFLRELCETLRAPGQERLYEDLLIRAANHVDQVQAAGCQEASSSSEDHSQASLLVQLASEAYLFHTPEQKPYARLRIHDHLENWSLDSINFRQFISRTFYNVHGAVPKSQAINDALAVLEGKAIHDSPEFEVHTRIAENQGRIYLDLANSEWTFVEVTANDWSVVHQPPVAFRRPRGMKPLPTPQRGGSLHALNNFVNIAEEDRPLLYAWAIAAMRPQGPFPVLSLSGEQGTAKSTTSKILRMLIDPNSADLRAEPRDVHNLCIGANNSWILPFDNLSYLHPWFSDALCRLSTGGGFSTRELYTNNEETLFQVQRPVILNGIEEFGFRSDLLDRSILITLLPITPQQRRCESDFFRDFEQALPYLLGALLDATVIALRNFPNVRIAESPRMADFARWAVAAEPGLPIAAGSFLARYMQNRQNAHALALEGSPLTIAIQNLMASRTTWQGTATVLLQQLVCLRTSQQDSLYGNGTRAPNGWPSNAQKLSAQLRRLAPNLRDIGIYIDSSRGRVRQITINTHPADSLLNSCTTA
jgi:hypothetical protein